MMRLTAPPSEAGNGAQLRGTDARAANTPLSRRRATRRTASLIAAALAAMLFTTLADTATVRYTALAAACAPDHVTLYGQAQGSKLVRTIATRTAVAGRKDSIRFEPGDSTLTVWLTVTDTRGRESCRSNSLGFNLTLDTPQSGETPALTRTEIIDVSGRHVSLMRTPGVYFVRELRDGAWSKRRVVVIR